MEQFEVLVRSFNECINARDLEGLSRLMSDDHVFIDTANNATKGRAACLQAWRRFFGAFPDYRNEFEEMRTTQGVAAVIGHSSCPDPRLSGPALWQAKVEDGLIAQWRVFEDTPENRRALGLSDA